MVFKNDTTLTTHKKVSVFRTRNQFLSVIWVDIITIIQGCVIGWLSPALSTLLSEEKSPIITGKVSLEEASWIGSLLAVGSIAGNVLFSFIASKLGRKNTLILLAIPNIIFWVMIEFLYYVEYYYIARFIGGLTGGGMFSCIPHYVSEIASPHVRGRLGNLFSIMYCSGMLIGFIIGAYLSYFTIPIVMLFPPIIYIIGLLFFPETPQFLLKQNRIEDAERSLRFYRNHSENCKNINQNRAFKVEFEKLQVNTQHIDKNENKLTIRDYCAPVALHSFFCGILIIILHQFSGVTVVINYANLIFENSGSNFDPNSCAIIIGVTQLMGCATASILVDRIGRKILFISTLFLAGLSNAIMGIHSYLIYLNFNIPQLNWIPITCMSFMIFLSSAGFMSIAVIILPEIFPLNLRGTGTTMCLTLLSIFLFINIKMFPILMQIIGLHGCMWIFAMVGILGSLLNIFILKETASIDINVIANENQITRN